MLYSHREIWSETRPVKRLYIILFGLTAAILTGLSGCGWFGTASRTVYQDDTLRVFLEADPTVTSGRSVPNDHPVSLDTTQLSLLLRGVEVERPPGLLKSLVSGPTREAAFSKGEIIAFAPQLKEAFAQASSKERVSFALIRSSSGQGSELTAGGGRGRGGGGALPLRPFWGASAKKRGGGTTPPRPALLPRRWA